MFIFDCELLDHIVIKRPGLSMIQIFINEVAIVSDYSYCCLALFFAGKVGFNFFTKPFSQEYFHCFVFFLWEVILLGHIDNIFFHSAVLMNPTRSFTIVNKVQERYY